MVRHPEQSGGALLLAAVLAIAWTPSAAAQVDLERKVKSAFILNFAKFISWPTDVFASDAEPLTICVQDSADADTLRSVVGDRRIDRRPIQVTALTADAGCQIVYVSGDQAAQVAPVIEAQAQRGVLTVYESEQVVDGGVIRFFVRDRRIRFEIDRESAAQADLSISSKLLRVATLRGEG